MIKKLEAQHEEYLKDESRLVGQADSISFPSSQKELEEIAAGLWAEKVSVTVQGARTGICGGAVPMGGHILNLEKMNAVLDLRREAGRYILTVEPGVRLSEINAGCAAGSFACHRLSDAALKLLKELRASGEYGFAPDPTETSATIGGMFASNAKGMNACLHGDTASHIHAAEVLLPDGSLWNITRGQYVFDQTGCALPGGGRLELGSLPAGPYPTKGGPAAYAGMDLLDLFAGSEGMLGIVTRLEVILTLQPAQKWGVLFFFDELSGAASLIRGILEQGQWGGVRYAALELFHSSSLRLMAGFKGNVTRLRKIPDFPPLAQCALYLELEGDDEEEMEEALGLLLESFVELGGREEDTWAATGELEMEKFKLLRHAAPESVNARIDEIRQTLPAVAKLCADMTAPGEHLEKTLEMYYNGLEEARLQGAIFGHAADNHFHVNIMAETMEEYARGQALIAAWAQSIKDWGGGVLSENGVGKTKRELFAAYAHPQQLETAKKIKSFFDPQGLLNPQNAL